MKRYDPNAVSAEVVMSFSKLSQSIKADTAGIDIINERVLELQVTEDGNRDL